MCFLTSKMNLPTDMRHWFKERLTMQQSTWERSISLRRSRSGTSLWGLQILACRIFDSCRFQPINWTDLFVTKGLLKPIWCRSCLWRFLLFVNLWASHPSQYWATWNRSDTVKHPRKMLSYFWIVMAFGDHRYMSVAWFGWFCVYDFRVCQKQ